MYACEGDVCIGVSVLSENGVDLYCCVGVSRADFIKLMEHAEIHGDDRYG